MNAQLLREVSDTDLPTFFAFNNDKEAIHMAAFVSRDPTDRAAFDAHWAKIRADEMNVNRTIVTEDGEVAGNIASFILEDERSVGYWLGRAYWGKGLATRALRELLTIVTERPLHARAAYDNVASLRVLQKCGFRIVGEGREYSNPRQAEIAEFILRLDAPAEQADSSVP